MSKTNTTRRGLQEVLEAIEEGAINADMKIKNKSVEVKLATGILKVKILEEIKRLFGEPI